MSLKSVRIVLCAIVLLPLAGHSQTHTYALPTHSGAMLLDLTGFKITQTSAKPENREIGVRAHDAGHTELLAFLFLTPENKKQTAATCLQQDLQQIRKDHGKFTEQLNPLHTDNGEAATIALSYPNGNQVLYKYAGSGDQCLVIQVYADKGSRLDLAEASALLSRQHYDQHYLPTTDDVAQYQGIRGRAIMISAKPPAGTLTPKMLVTWYGPGGIPMPTSPEWKLTLLTAYNKAARPAAEFKNDTTNVIASFIISENLSGNPTSEGCRKDVMDGILKEEGAIISNSIDGTISDGHGGQFATASHLMQLPGGSHNHDLFAFAGQQDALRRDAHLKNIFPGNPRRRSAASPLKPRPSPSELGYAPKHAGLLHTLASLFYITKSYECWPRPSMMLR